jgi:hypothetical protein
MSLTIGWHIQGPLEITSLDPGNGGSIELKGRGEPQGITLFTKHNEWWALYHSLPKSPGFYVYNRSGEKPAYQRDEDEYMPYLRGFLPKEGVLSEPEPDERDEPRGVILR